MNINHYGNSEIMDRMAVERLEAENELQRELIQDYKNLANMLEEDVGRLKADKIGLEGVIEGLKDKLRRHLTMGGK